MAKNKMSENAASVDSFIGKIDNETKRDDSYKLIELYKSITGFDPKMWGSSIIGFGSYHYKYESGREGDAPLGAFSPRKDSIVVYLANEFDGKKELLAELGKHKSSVACVYIKKLEDLDIAVLKKLIKKSIEVAKNMYPQK